MKEREEGSGNQGSSTVGGSGEAAGEPLETAIRYLRAGLCAAGEISGGDDEATVQWRLLRGYARNAGRFRAHEPNLWLGRKGGSEHICRHDKATNWWEKSTHEDMAGWHVDVDDGFACYPATPLQYLERLLRSRDLFADRIEFVGIEFPVCRPHSSHIRTRQHHVDGDAPNEARLRRWIDESGYQIVRDVRVGAYDSLACRRGNVWLFDVRPMNFVHANDVDELFPIDVIVQLAPTC